MPRKRKNKLFKGLSEELHPWEKQAGETQKAHAAFCIYRDLGPIRRSTTLAAKSIGSPTRSLKHWYETFLWKERVEAFDKFLDEESIDTTLKELVSARKRFVNFGLALQSIAGHEVKLLTNKIKLDDTRSYLTKSEAKSFLKEGVRMELLGRGEPADITETRDGEAVDSYSQMARRAVEHERKQADKERHAANKEGSKPVDSVDK